MATELTVQSERAFQKQPHIFLNSKAVNIKSRRRGKGGRRWYKDVGLGFRTPKTAIEGAYIGTSEFEAKVGDIMDDDADAMAFQTRSALSPAWSRFAAVS